MSTPFPAQIKIPATYMRGGTSKGIFFKLDDLPAAAQTPGAARDNILLRVLGSPDRYGRQIPPYPETQQYVRRVVAHLARRVNGEPPS